MTTEPLDRVLECALLAAHVLLENGAETYRAEESAVRICRRFGVSDPQIIALPTGTFASLTREGSVPASGLRRISKRTTDLGRVDAANDVSRAVEQGSLSLDEAIVELTRLGAPAPKKKLGLPLLAASGSSALFALLFGGGWFDFLAAALCGLTVQAIASSFRREDSFHFIVSLIGGAVIALLASLATGLTGMGDQSVVIAGALMPLLPGLAMTGAVRDTMRGDLVSGVARGAEALLVAVSLAAGVGLVLGARVALEGLIA